MYKHHLLLRNLVKSTIYKQNNRISGWICIRGLRILPKQTLYKAFAGIFVISDAYWVKKLHFAEQNYQSNHIKANINNEANQKISGDSHCLIAEQKMSICKSFHCTKTTSHNNNNRHRHRICTYRHSQPHTHTHMVTHTQFFHLPPYFIHQTHWNRGSKIITICTPLFFMYENLFWLYMQRTLDHVHYFYFSRVCLFFFYIMHRHNSVCMFLRFICRLCCGTVDCVHSTLKHWGLAVVIIVTIVECRIEFSAVYSTRRERITRRKYGS